MSGPVDQIRRRIDDLLFERPATPAHLTAAGLLLLAGIGLAALLWWPSGRSDPSRLPFVTVPLASVGARIPPGRARFRVGGSTWVVHLERGRLLVRRAPTVVVPRVPSTG
ncbi:MAG: hypothetical protein MK177_01495 [Acidimicrobiales bacterium]|nr:hypothetical protein [Acidimicrobiales bacterium]